MDFVISTTPPIFLIDNTDHPFTFSRQKDCTPNFSSFYNNIAASAMLLSLFTVKKPRNSTSRTRRHVNKPPIHLKWPMRWFASGN
jgi:hypothetical protein